MTVILTANREGSSRRFTLDEAFSYVCEQAAGDGYQMYGSSEVFGLLEVDDWECEISLRPKARAIRVRPLDRNVVADGRGGWVEGDHGPVTR